jgi:hypothetical protein
MDIRLTRGRSDRVWFWIGTLVVFGIVALGAAAVFGDPTAHGRGPGSGAAHFGADRAPVRPVVIESFATVKQLNDRELGRLLNVIGTAESGVRRNAVYVRMPDGRRILVRFEPAPPAGKLSGIVNGGGVDVNGYLQKISRAEFNVWMDTLGVVIPRPAPGVKFGDLPDSNFIRIDSLFVKDYYVSVRPEGINPRHAASFAAPAPAPAAAPADSAPSQPVADTARLRKALQLSPISPNAPVSPGDTVKP